MILPFSQQINGKETLFPERILKGLLEYYERRESPMTLEIVECIYDYGAFDGYLTCDDCLATVDQQFAKVHSMREDKKNRWKAGILIDFFINVRQKNMYRFAPKIHVVSTQEIEIRYTKKKEPRIFIDGKMFYTSNFSRSHDIKMLHFAHADGFDSVEEFFDYFNTDFTGKIIHWTDKRY